MTAPPMGYMGSKARIAARIVELLPPHRGYVEPYAGSLSVLLAKPPGGLEVANDLDGDLVTFWRVLREYDRSWPIPDDVDELERARLVWVKLSQGRGGSLRATGWRYHEVSRGRSASMPRTLQSYVRRILDAADRLLDVTLECRPALEVVERYGREPDTLLYVDPPYLYRTRSRTARYRHELGEPQAHRDLADALHACRAGVVLSGYPDPLYEDLYRGWDRVELPAGTGQYVGGGYQQRVEVLWSNRELLPAGQLELVAGEVSA